MKNAFLIAMRLLSIAFFLAATTANAQESSPDLDLAASSWGTLTGWYGNVVPLNNDANGSLYLDFPADRTKCKSHCDTINYLFAKRVPRDISGGALVVTLKVETLTGSPEFHHTGWKDVCTTPPTVRPFFWAHNNSFADGDRWWAWNASVDLQWGLTQGEITLTIPIDPANFSGVFGELANQDAQTLAWWDSAIHDVSAIGVTFGGGCSFGHGVYVREGTGTARFTVLNYDASFPCPAATPCIQPSCTRAGEIGSSSSGLHQCLEGNGDFLNCGSGQTIHLVSTACNRGACCSAAPACLCPESCPMGQYLECR